MDAKELRKKLEEGLKPDSSGKTTPIQRLTPFLQELVAYLEEREPHLPSAEEMFQAITDFNDRQQSIADMRQVSSDDATQAVPAKTKHASVGASKPAA